jgi:hypothetical protein
MLMKRRQAMLWVPGAQGGGSGGHSLLIPVVVSVSFLLFVVTMYVNDCPAHRKSPPSSSSKCILPSLGRLSFQPLSDNPLLGPSSAA